MHSLPSRNDTRPANKDHCSPSKCHGERGNFHRPIHYWRVSFAFGSMLLPVKYFIFVLAWILGNGVFNFTWLFSHTYPSVIGNLVPSLRFKTESAIPWQAVIKDQIHSTWQCSRRQIHPRQPILFCDCERLLLYQHNAYWKKTSKWAWVWRRTDIPKGGKVLKNSW